MARKARVEFEGAVYHVLDRGDRREAIFGHDANLAVCTMAQIEYLVSWNFRHLVNIERENAFNAVNLLQGYSMRRSS